MMSIQTPKTDENKQNMLSLFKLNFRNDDNLFNTNTLKHIIKTFQGKKT